MATTIRRGMFAALRQRGAASRRSFAAALLLAGAASCGAPPDPTIKIVSIPEGATVYIDGERAGTAGDTFALHYGADPRRKIYVQLCKRGYQPAEAMWELAELPAADARGQREKSFQMEKVR
jgi:hypothetical protein